MRKEEQIRRNEKIKALFYTQEPVRLIAAKYGVYTQRIYQIWKDFGLNPKKRFDK